MRAAVITRFGGPEVIQVLERPTPVPGDSQVRVRVQSAGMNRADLLQRLGRYPPPLDVAQDIPGLEFAGLVESVGPNARVFREGDRVFGLCGGGAQAEYVVAHERTLARVPDAITTLDAGAVPEAFMTVHDALFTQARLGVGESVLIHSIGSGVGTAAVQLAHAAGARTIGTSRTPGKLARAGALGLDEAILTGDFLSGRAHVQADVVLDVLGASALDANLAALRTGGRLLLLATLTGDTASVSISALLRRRAHVIGTLMRPRPLEERIAVTSVFARQVLTLLESRRVRPIVDSVLPLSQISEAHVYLASNKAFGKVVLDITG